MSKGPTEELKPKLMLRREKTNLGDRRVATETFHESLLSDGVETVATML